MQVSYSAGKSEGLQRGHIIEKLVHQLDALNWTFGPFEEIRAVGRRAATNPRTWDELSAILTPRSRLSRYAVQVNASFGTGFASDEVGTTTLELVFVDHRSITTTVGHRFVQLEDSGKMTDLGDNSYWWPSRSIADFVMAWREKRLAATGAARSAEMGARSHETVC